VRRIVTAALCALCSLTMMAVLPVAALAEPVFLTKAVVGEPAPSSVLLTGTIGSSAFESRTGSRYACVDSAGTTKVDGEVAGPKTVRKVVLTFHECETNGFSECGTDEKARLTVTNHLEGELGPISPTLPGLRLWAEGDKGGSVMKFTCAGGALQFDVRGTITGSLSGAAGENAETGKLVSSINLTFREAKGIQKYQGFEAGEPGQWEWSASGNAFEDLALAGVVKLQTVPSTLGLGVTR
jgi:hypothetical protein